MGNVIPENYLPPQSQPWGREMTNRLKQLEDRLDSVLADTSGSVGSLNNTLNSLTAPKVFSAQVSGNYYNNSLIANSVLLQTVNLEFALSKTSEVSIEAETYTKGLARSTSASASSITVTSYLTIETILNDNIISLELFGFDHITNSTVNDFTLYGSVASKSLKILPAGRHVLEVNFYATHTAAGTGAAARRDINDPNVKVTVI
jgi:hypothetical protein